MKLQGGSLLRSNEKRNPFVSGALQEHGRWLDNNKTKWITTEQPFSKVFVTIPYLQLMKTKI